MHFADLRGGTFPSASPCLGSLLWVRGILHHLLCTAAYHSLPFSFACMAFSPHLSTSGFISALPSSPCPSYSTLLGFCLPLPSVQLSCQFILPYHVTLFIAAFLYIPYSLSLPASLLCCTAAPCAKHRLFSLPHPSSSTFSVLCSFS